MPGCVHVQRIARKNGLGRWAGRKGICRVEDCGIRRPADDTGCFAIGGKPAGDCGAAPRRRGQQNHFNPAIPPAGDLADQRGIEVLDGNRRLTGKPAARSGIIGAISKNDQINTGQVAPVPARFPASRRLAANAVARHFNPAAERLLQNVAIRSFCAAYAAACNMAVTDDGNFHTVRGAGKWIRHMGHR